MLYITDLQQIDDYNTYNMIIIQNHKNYKKFLHCLVWRGYLYCHFIYGLTVVVIIFFLVEHILGCGMVAYFKFILDLRVSLPWFFITVSFFIINHIFIIILECYSRWLPSQTCWPSMGYFSLVWEDPPDLGSTRLDRCCCHSVHGQICGAVLRCGAVSLSCHMCHVSLFRSRRPFIIGGPFRIVHNVYNIIVCVWF